MNVAMTTPDRRATTMGESTITVKWWAVFMAILSIIGFLFMGWTSNNSRITRLEEKCTNCIESNPLITVKDGKPTSITIDSPARNANTGHDATIYTLYNNTYGVSITKDIKSVLRPKESTWDIGAYEYDPNVATIKFGTGSSISIGPGGGTPILQ